MIMITNEDKRFQPVKISTVGMIKLYLMNEGWSVFSTNYDFDNQVWEFSCEYTRENGMYDVTASYDIEVKVVSQDNGCTNCSNFVFYPPVKR